MKEIQELLDASIDSSDILTAKKMTPDGLREAKMVLGFLNATNNIVKTRMQFYKTFGVIEDPTKTNKKRRKK